MQGIASRKTPNYGRGAHASHAFGWLLQGFQKIQGPGSRLSGAMTFNGYLGRCRGAFGAILGFCEACRRGGLPALNHDLLMRISSFSSELPNILKDIQNPQSAETSDFGCLNIASIASTQRDNDGLNKGPGGTSPGCTQYIQHSVAGRWMCLEPCRKKLAQYPSEKVQAQSEWVQKGGLGVRQTVQWLQEVQHRFSVGQMGPS